MTEEALRQQQLLLMMMMMLLQQQLLLLLIRMELKQLLKEPLGHSKATLLRLRC